MNASPTLLRRWPGTPLRPRAPAPLDPRVQRILARTAQAWGLLQHAGEPRATSLLAIPGQVAG